jgi:N-acetylglutamate synthase-like GNAT family acetyltransferase
MSQIRIANKQDEPHIRALSKDALAGIQKEFDLDGSDADLKNIEWSYFGHEGAFVVLELDGAIAGIAGATKLSDDALEIKRFYVRPGGLDNAHEDLLNMLFDFARNMDYRIIEFAPSAAQFAPPALIERKKFQNQDGRLFVSLWST